MNYDIGKNIEDVMQAHFECDALHVQGQKYTHRDLYTRADMLRHVVNQVVDKSNQFIGIFCYRSVDAYAGLLGALFSKNAYLPINPALSADKITKMLSISDCNTVILGEEAVGVFAKIISSVSALTVICPNPGKKINELSASNSRHTFIFPEEFPKKSEKKDIISKDAPAYLMFTSGSTGDPKGIVVSHKNLFTYARYIIEEFEFSSEDRISQAPDISFDLSIQDLFSAFLSGGCLFVLPKEVMIAPHKYINDHKLTVWTSVPSVGIFMDQVGQLVPNSLPTLRLSLFCGEGLPCELATKWQNAASNSQVINFYGPTEATVMFTSHQWDVESEAENCFNGLVSIGKPFDHMEIKLVEDGLEVIDGSAGEICIYGDQVIRGYFKDAPLTEEKFVTFDDDVKKVWYRTGDLAKKLNNGSYFFVGRVDDQVQVRGHRVEMLEIDNALRGAVDHHMAASIPVKAKDSETIEDIVAFCEFSDKNISEEEILQHCSLVLPEYMVPSIIYFVDKLPLNQNGKIDKKALHRRVNDGSQKDNKAPCVDLVCDVCLKGLQEDKNLDGFGLLRIIKHNGQEGYICHICLRGF